MLILRRSGCHWQLAGDWGAIDIPLEQARSMALQILTDSASLPAASNGNQGIGEPKAETRAQRATRLIVEDIAAGVFVPGQRLDEVLLAKRYQVSRTPIREALFQLTIAGTVVREPHKGCRVADTVAL